MKCYLGAKGVSKPCPPLRSVKRGLRVTSVRKPNKHRRNPSSCTTIKLVELGQCGELVHSSFGICTQTGAFQVEECIQIIPWSTNISLSNTFFGQLSISEVEHLSVRFVVKFCSQIDLKQVCFKLLDC